MPTLSATQEGVTEAVPRIGISGMGSSSAAATVLKAGGADACAEVQFQPAVVTADVGVDACQS